MVESVLSYLLPSLSWWISSSQLYNPLPKLWMYQTEGFLNYKPLSMASSFVPDVWGWITNLPTIIQWNTNVMSLGICTTGSTHPSMNLSVTRSSQSQNPYVTFSIYADFNMPIPLWTSSPIHLKNKTQPSIEEEDVLHLFSDIIKGVLMYGPNKKTSFRFPTLQIREDFRDVFNLAFLTLAFLICIYEAPNNLRQGCLDTLRIQLTSSRCREASKLLVRVLGSNLEERWMKSLNLAVTNWIQEFQPSNHSFKTPSPLFSYAFSASGLWKVQLYCPIIAMSIENPTAATQDERLLFSLKYQQLEGVIQLAYKVILRENWINVVVTVDNIRCDVNPLVSETLMAERGYGSEEKHFPSRICLQLTPNLQSDVMSVSVSKSSDNPTHEVGLEKAIEGGFDPPNSYLGLKVSATETVTMSMRPWKFEQSVYGGSAILNWFLHEGVHGREVFSSKPSKLTLLQPRSWFRDRYSSAYRPFTKQGGVIFAGDEYGESVWWKVCGGALGKKMEWEIKGWIWLTYWPNKQRTFYSETRRLEFRELVYLSPPKVI